MDSWAIILLIPVLCVLGLIGNWFVLLLIRGFARTVNGGKPTTLTPERKNWSDHGEWRA